MLGGSVVHSGHGPCNLRGRVCSPLMAVYSAPNAHIETTGLVSGRQDSGGTVKLAQRHNVLVCCLSI